MHFLVHAMSSPSTLHYCLLPSAVKSNKVHVMRLLFHKPIFFVWVKFWLMNVNIRFFYNTNYLQYFISAMNVMTK